MQPGREPSDTGAPSFRERLAAAFLKPPAPSAQAQSAARTLDDLQAEARSLTERERVVGLFGGPIGGVIGILIATSLIDRDPKATLANGAKNPLHASITLYHELLIVLLVLAAFMVITALARKRLYLGIVLALYGLTVFNMHFWGFGVPFLLFGAWLMVRTYRLQQAVREAGGGTQPGATAPPRATLPKRNRRYTPPSA